MSQAYTTFDKLENGNLKISVTDTGREFLRELPHDEHGDPPGDDHTFHELLEDQLTSGWEWLPTTEMGLTNAPGFTDDALHNGQGDYIYVGRIYAFMQYETHNPLADLERNGFIMLEGYPGDDADIGQYSVLTRGGGQDDTNTLRIALTEEGARWLAPRSLNESGLQSLLEEHADKWQVGEWERLGDDPTGMLLIEELATERRYFYLSTESPIAHLARTGTVLFRLAVAA